MLFTLALFSGCLIFKICQLNKCGQNIVFCYCSGCCLHRASRKLSWHCTCVLWFGSDRVTSTWKVSLRTFLRAYLPILKLIQTLYDCLYGRAAFTTLLLSDKRFSSGQYHSALRLFFLLRLQKVLLIYRRQSLLYDAPLDMRMYRDMTLSLSVSKVTISNLLL